MIPIGIRQYPRAYRAALDILDSFNPRFPLNVSLLLENIGTHRIYDVSSATYNSTLAKSEEQELCPRRAWTIFNDQLDTYLIIWNAALPAASIRYSVAHEIGHVVLNHEREWPTDTKLAKQHKEAEADVFARTLLAPCKEIHTLCLLKPFSAQRIAAYFDIPYSVAKKLQYDYEYWLLLR